MVVITTNAWDENESVTKKSPSQMFGFHDLASDYFQVLAEKERPKPCRIIWTIVVLILCVFTGYMVYQLLSDYFQYSSYNVSSTIWKHNVTFPAITICSTNYVNHTALKADLTPEDENEDNLFEDLEALMFMIKDWDGKGQITQRINITDFEELTDYEDTYGSIAYSYSNQFQDYIASARYDYMFEEVHKDFPNIDDVIFTTELGMCLELNDDGALQQTIRGVPGGFTIDLDAHIESYLSSTRTKGFIVFIRDQDETVMTNTGGYIIAPGTETFMKIKERDMARQKAPYGTCENTLSDNSKYDNHFMTVRECVQEQKLELMIKACECIPWYLADRLIKLNKANQMNPYVRTIDNIQNPTKGGRNRKRAASQSGGNRPASGNIPDAYRNSNISEYFCKFVNQNLCDSIVSHILRNKRNSINMGDCNEPCTYREWDVEMMTTQFPPSELYFDKYMQLPPWKASDTYTFDYVSDNMIRLHIFYDDIKVTNIQQTKAYQIQNFIAEFGGTVDLFIGFSFFTVFQLIEIAIAACIWKCSWRKKAMEKEGNDGGENAEDRV